MNRKGFAISIVMYAMVFLLIALFYILLSVVKARYTVNNNLRESIVQELNESNHGYTITYRRLKKIPTCKSYWVDNMDTPNNYDDDVIYITPPECTSSSNENSNIVNFNYVWYSGKLWRIVALYPDKTMKLITEDVIATINYGNGGSFETSYMYQWLNEDFLDTLYNSDRIVENTVWNYTPDSGSVPSRPESLSDQKTLTAKVGLLNAYVWTVDTWYSDNGKGFSQKAAGSSGDSWGIRPSIKLKYGVKFKGSGTEDDPYTIVGDIGKPVYSETFLNTRVSGEYVKFNDDIYRIVELDNNNTRIILNTVDDFTHDVISSSSGIWGKSTNTAYDHGMENQQRYMYADYYFNNVWYNAIPTNYKNMIVDGNFYMGPYSSINDSYKSTICKNIRNYRSVTTTIKECEKFANDEDKVFVGKVGLPRIGQMFSSNIITTSTPTQIVVMPSRALTYMGNYGDERAYFYNRYRPSITLSSSVKITGGEGTLDSPFEISL